MATAETGAAQAVLFDFDGVILESAGIKTQAFRDLFADRGEHLPAILEHHLQNLGVSRFEKFAWIYRELLREPLSEELSSELGERYSELALAQTLSCPMVEGARETLSWLRGRALAFVASATPQEELELIVRRRGLAELFDEVHGSPRAKPAICADLLERHGLGPNEAVLVGDGLSDYRAAEAVGIRFVLRETEAQRELFDGVSVPRIPDLTQLPALLELSGP